MGTFFEHGALEFSERAYHLHHHPARRRRGVDRLGQTSKARLFLLDPIHEGSDIVNNRIAIDYILELTSGVTGRIVELVRLSARCAIRRDSRTVTVDLLQEAGKEFASDLASERNVSH
jgi:hypothetical protein